MSDKPSHSERPEFDTLLSDIEAARVLDSTSASMKQSRYTGMLFGRPAPKFIKMGRSAKYKLSTLLEFRDQFQEFQNTAEAHSAQEKKWKLSEIQLWEQRGSKS